MSLISPNPGEELWLLSFVSGEFRSPAFDRSVIVNKRCVFRALRVAASSFEGATMRRISFFGLRGGEEGLKQRS